MHQSQPLYRLIPATLIPTTQATIMTDPGMADRTYVGPMTPELVEQILAKVGTGVEMLGWRAA